ncbi:MAG: glycoside hydrolase family 3 C-terminal domain-containing protein [Clostridia bacterium]|nr:glycoside hydrolase family 3 C-terminal domain-containing protein [Clostridia bacterium]
MNREQARQKAVALVSQMTVEEAASQLRYDAPAIDRLGIPAYNWWNEALHGVARAGTATMWPQAIGVAATFNPALVQQLGDVAATEGRAKYNAATRHGDRDIYKGLTFWSPNINLFREPRWGRGHETYGEDPFLTAELGKAYVRGLQGDGETMKAAACAKHFAVHSGPESLRHEFNAVASPKDMEETYLPAFEALVKDAKVEAVMGAYNRTNGEPCCGSQALMVELLRGKWGFEGHFTSDCWAIRDFHEHHMVTASMEESAALALKMGCDVNCGNTYIYLMKAYEQGLVTEEEIRTAAIHLFTTRYLLGIMEGSEFDSIPYSVVECPEHLAKAHQATLESCVLLKNDGLLPLRRESIKTLGIIGPNANSRDALIGNYHGTSSRYITVAEGLQDAMGDDVRVLYSDGSHLWKDRTENLSQYANDRLSEALSVAENSDVVVLVVGLDESLEGEQGDTGNSDASGDKVDLLLPKAQRDLLDAVLAVGKPTVICLMAGSSIDLGPAAQKANAILHVWYPGARGGKAVAELMLGRVSPSGKLPLTFYHNDQLGLMPAFTDYSMKGRTYRYFEHEPLFPFGFGLTYGDVSVQSASVSQQDGRCVITAQLINQGSVFTQDVVQVYCQNEGSANAPRNPRLVAFQRVDCPAGQTVTVTLAVQSRQLEVVNEAGEHVMEGSPVFYVGMGQPDSLTEKLTGHKSVVCKL